MTDLIKEGSDDKEDDGTGKKSDYDYLLNMNFWQLTMEKVEELEKACAQKEKEIAILMKTTIHEIWTRDLDAFLKALSVQEETDEAEMRDQIRGTRAKATRGVSKLANEKDIKKPKRKKKKEETSSEESDAYSDDEKRKRRGKNTAAAGMTSARLAPRALDTSITRNYCREAIFRFYFFVVGLFFGVECNFKVCFWCLFM